MTTVRPGRAPLVLVTALAGMAAVAASAHLQANGLPAYTDGYARWEKLNRRPITAPGAHDGVKNVYASKRRDARGRFPDGTVIVKSIAQTGQPGLPGEVAVMRKVRGTWKWVEYTRSGSRYGVLARGALCTSCHMQARSRDWVFTRR